MAYPMTYDDPADALTQRTLPSFDKAQQTQAMNPFQNQGVPQDVLTDPAKSKALYNMARQSVVNQYPMLDGNPQFESDMADSFSKFINGSLQRGSDMNSIWSATVAPTLAKWQSAAARQSRGNTAALEAHGLDVLKNKGAAGLLDEPGLMQRLMAGPNATFWKQQDVKTQKASIDPITQKKIDAYKDIMAKDMAQGNTSGAADAESRARSMEASAAPAASALSGSPTPVEASSQDGGDEFPARLATASPQGTSGYVQYDDAGKALVAPWSMTIGGKTTTGGSPTQTATRAADDLTGEGIEKAYTETNSGKVATPEIIQSLKKKGLSASDARKWLDDNGYTIPKKAAGTPSDQPDGGSEAATNLRLLAPYLR